MCLYNKSITCGLFLGLVLHACADVKIMPEDENLTGRHRPLSQEFRQFEPEHLQGMTAEKLAKMSLEDPLLRYAYVDIFLRNLRDPDTIEPEQAAVLEDMRRRGDSITPLLLELARQNQDSMFESILLDEIDDVGNIDLEPYLEYARTLLQERTQTMNANLAECASKLLANHGSKQDVALLEQVIAARSYTARGVTESLKVFKSRLERLERAKQVTRPMLRDKPSASGANADSSAAEANKQSVGKTNSKVSTRSWGIWVIVGIVLSSLVWLWRKKTQNRK